MKKFSIIIVALFIAVYCILGAYGIWRMSITFDELAHIPAGYTYLAEKDYRMNFQDHPPLAKMVAAMPLLFLKPETFTHHPSWLNGQQWSYGDLFMFHNIVDHNLLLRFSRIMMLGVSVLLGIIIFIWARSVGGIGGGIIASLCYYCFPGFIAHGSLVTTDVPLSLCYFLTIYYFWRLYRNKSYGRAVWVGVACGCAISVKFSGILILLSLGLLTLWWLYHNKEINFQEGLIYWLIIGLTASAVILIVYRFDQIPLFFYGIKNIFSQVQSGRSTFLLGKYSNTGWWYYFPVAILLKTPVSLLILLFVSWIVICRRLKSSGDDVSVLMFLVLPALVYFIFSIKSPMQIGHRHILPVYPFLFVGLGWAWKYMHAKIKIFSLICLCGYTIEVAAIQPYNLEYVNVLIGSPNNAYHYLGDSNLDWGQSLRELSAYLKKINQRYIFLSYFGTGDPHQEGITYVPISWYPIVERTGDAVDALIGARILLGVTATQRQAIYNPDRNLFRWLDDIKPMYIIARSLFIFDLTHNQKALMHLKEMLEQDGNQKTAAQIQELIAYDSTSKH